MTWKVLPHSRRLTFLIPGVDEQPQPEEELTQHKGPSSIQHLACSVQIQTLTLRKTLGLRTFLNLKSKFCHCAPDIQNFKMREKNSCTEKIGLEIPGKKDLKTAFSMRLVH